MNGFVVHYADTLVSEEKLLVVKEGEINGKMIILIGRHQILVMGLHTKGIQNSARAVNFYIQYIQVV